MRACNGCRKRKIKCDAATTNAWPCSACTRLKLVCIPPAIGQNGDFLTSGQSNEADRAPTLDTSKQPNPPHHSLPTQHNFVEGASQLPGSIESFNNGVGIYSQYIPQSHPNIYGEAPPSQMAVPHQSFHQQNVFSAVPPQPLASVDSGVFVDQEQSTAESLSEALGELKIDETGIGKTLLYDFCS
jgi:Fungal Zn(2)-Cys(6) binuclear cluster domain